MALNEITLLWSVRCSMQILNTQLGKVYYFAYLPLGPDRQRKLFQVLELGSRTEGSYTFHSSQEFLQHYWIKPSECTLEVKKDSQHIKAELSFY